MAWFTDENRLPAFIRAFKPALKRSLESQAEQSYKTMIKEWESGNDAMGRPWEPLAPSTVRQKGHAQPLIETRQMIDSADYMADGLSAAIYIEDEPAKVLAHEHGLPDRGLPPRPILGPVREHVEQDAGSIMTKAFDKAWARSQVSGTVTQVGFKGGDSL